MIHLIVFIAIVFVCGTFCGFFFGVSYYLNQLRKMVLGKQLTTNGAGAMVEQSAYLAGIAGVGEETVQIRAREGWERWNNEGE